MTKALQKIGLGILAVLLIFLNAPGRTEAQSASSYSPWKILNQIIQPQIATWTLRLPYLAPDAGECLTVDAQGDVETTACSGGSGTGGIGTTSPWTAGQLVQVHDEDTVKSIATSSLGLLTTHVAEGSNQYFTNARVQTYLDSVSKGFFFSTTSADYWETQQTARTADDLTNNTLNDLSQTDLGDPNLTNIVFWNDSANQFDFLDSYTDISISGTSLVVDTLPNLTGTLDVNSGGTGAASFGQGWIYTDGGTGALAASTSPTVNYVTATSTTATSTLPMLNVGTSLALFGTYGNSLDDFCIAITGGAGLCDGTDDTGGGGGSSEHVDAGLYVYPGEGDYHSAPKYVATSTATSTFAGSVQVTAGAATGGNNIGEGLLGLSMGDHRGSGISLHSSSTAQSSDGELLHIEQYNASHANEILKIENSSTQGSSEEIYIVSNVPDVVLCDNTDSSNDCVEYEVENHGSALWNSRNSADNAFERNMQLAAYRLGGMLCLGANFDCPFLTSKFTIVGSSTLDYLDVNTPGDTTAGGNVFTIRTGGNVGVGTTTPYAKLSVVGPVVAEYFHATSTTATSTFGKLDINGLNDGTIKINGTSPYYFKVLNDSNTTIFSVKQDGETYLGGRVVNGEWRATTIATQYGGTGATTFNYGLIGSTGGTAALTNFATSSLGLLTTNVAEGSNLYHTDARAQNAAGWVDDGSTVRLDDISDSVGIGTTTPNFAHFTVQRPDSNSNIAGFYNSLGRRVMEIGHVRTNINGSSLLPTAEGMLHLTHNFTDAFDPLMDLNDGDKYPLVLHNLNTATASSTGIGFSVTNATNNIGASILFTRTGGNSQGKLSFYTKQSTTATDDPAIALVLDEAGRATFGSTTADARLSVRAASTTDVVDLLVDSTHPTDANPVLRLKTPGSQFYLGLNNDGLGLDDFSIWDGSNHLLSIAGDGNGTTTLKGLNISGAATSTSNVGFNITSGCYAISGTCISGGSGGSGSSGGLGTTTPWTAGQLGMVVNNSTLTGVSTSSVTISSPLSSSGTAGSVVGGSGWTIGITADAIGDTQLAFNTGQHLTTTSDVTFNKLTMAYSSSTVYSSFVTASTTNLIINGESINDLTGNDLSSSAGKINVDTLPNLTGTLDVDSGGTGATTLTGLLQGNGTGAFTAITDSSTGGQVLRVTGASTYAWGALDLADTDAVTGVLPVANIHSSVIVSTEIDTAAELETILGGVNVLYETEIDAGSELAALLDDETGSGSVVFSGSPTLTGLTTLAQASSTRFSVHDTAYFGGTATSTFNSAGVLTLATPLAAGSGGTGLSSLGTGIATWLGTPSSANLAAALTNETGSGSAVFSAAPTLTGVTTLAQASTTGMHTFGHASSTQWSGGGLTDCDGDGQTLGWDATTLMFTCGDDDSGGAGTQTPWGSAIDGGGFALTNAGKLTFTHFEATSTTATSSALLFSVGSSTPNSTALFQIGTSSPLFHINKISGKIGIGGINTSPSDISFGNGSNVNINPNIKLLAQDATDARMGACANDQCAVLKSDGGIFAYDYALAAARTLIFQEFGGGADFGAADWLEIPHGTGKTANDPGEITHDTSDNQIVVDDFVMARANEKLYSFTIASTSPDFASGGIIPIPPELDGYTITALRCYVDGGTSKVVNLSDGTNDTDSLTCATTLTSDDGSIANATVTAGELMRIEMGATTGSVDYVSFSVFGQITRE